ncbi:uncharacterized protein LOC123036562 [Varanus komodoensis]|uniref:uncharacterized protein LOC123036562 n=1 Tax=Varanus komodoensis TaxID=61221 RepID=UPI001CF7DC1E|nr:uncharacterized protein LOC123036562 [Varanus komodoensis]
MPSSMVSVPRSFFHPRFVSSALRSAWIPHPSWLPSHRLQAGSSVGPGQEGSAEQGAGTHCGLLAMTAPPRRYDFSLWYCLSDDHIATSIGKILTKQGLRGYIEHQDHVAGRSVIASVNEIIQSSRVALVLLTSRSLADPWCQRVVEWNLVHTILQEGTKVIPVCVDVRQEQMPPALRHLTGLEYRGPFFRQRLLDSVQKARSPTRTPCPSSLTRPVFLPRTSSRVRSIPCIASSQQPYGVG